MHIRSRLRLKTVLECFVTLEHEIFAVEENMESIDNPLHEAAKRGNINFLRECLANRVYTLTLEEFIVLSLFFISWKKCVSYAGLCSDRSL